MIDMSVEITIDAKSEVLAIAGINTAVKTLVILVTAVVAVVDNEAVGKVLIERVGFPSSSAFPRKAKVREPAGFRGMTSLQQQVL